MDRVAKRVGIPGVRTLPRSHLRVDIGQLLVPLICHGKRIDVIRVHPLLHTTEFYSTALGPLFPASVDSFWGE
eukprot:COSAG06_NODE_3106_length_5852_cov_6.243177_2_plen_73_part_00